MGVAPFLPETRTVLAMQLEDTLTHEVKGIMDKRVTSYCDEGIVIIIHL